MSAGTPDTVGYPLDRARELLQAAGAGPVSVVQVGTLEEASPQRRAMVLRQRPGEDGAVELTAALEWRTPTRQDD